MILKKIYDRLYSLYFNGTLKLKEIYNYYFGFYVAKNEFPYELMKPMPPGGEKLMEICCEELKKAGFNYFLTSGTALSVYRDNKFLAHDPDVDIDILGPIDREKIHDIFTNKLKMTLGSEILYRRKPQQIVYYTDDHLTFDMHFWEKKGDWVYNYSQSDSTWKHPYRFYKKMDEIEFLGETYPMPNDIEGYLAYMYGDDWRIPKMKTSFLGDRKDLQEK